MVEEIEEDGRVTGRMTRVREDKDRLRVRSLLPLKSCPLKL